MFAHCMILKWMGHLLFRVSFINNNLEVPVASVAKKNIHLTKDTQHSLLSISVCL